MEANLSWDNFACTYGDFHTPFSPRRTNGFVATAGSFTILTRRSGLAPCAATCSVDFSLTGEFLLLCLYSLKLKKMVRVELQDGATLKKL